MNKKAKKFKDRTYKSALKEILNPETCDSHLCAQYICMASLDNERRYDLYWDDRGDLFADPIEYMEAHKPDYADMDVYDLMDKLQMADGWDFIVVNCETQVVVMSGALSFHSNIDKHNDRIFAVLDDGQTDAEVRHG